MLHVVSPKGIVSTSPETFTAKRGESVTLTCSTDAHESNTTKYLWLHKISDAVCTNTDCSGGIYSFNLTNEGIKNFISIYNTIKIPMYFYILLQKP